MVDDISFPKRSFPRGTCSSKAALGFSFPPWDSFLCWIKHPHTHKWISFWMFCMNIWTSHPLCTGQFSPKWNSGIPSSGRGQRCFKGESHRKIHMELFRCLLNRNLLFLWGLDMILTFLFSSDCLCQWGVSAKKRRSGESKQTGFCIVKLMFFHQIEWLSCPYHPCMVFMPTFNLNLW